MVRIGTDTFVVSDSKSLQTDRIIIVAGHFTITSGACRTKLISYFHAQSSYDIEMTNIECATLINCCNFMTTSMLQ